VIHLCTLCFCIRKLIEDFLCKTTTDLKITYSGPTSNSYLKIDFEVESWFRKEPKLPYIIALTYNFKIMLFLLVKDII